MLNEVLPGRKQDTKWSNKQDHGKQNPATAVFEEIGKLFKTQTRYQQHKQHADHQVDNLGFEGS